MHHRPLLTFAAATVAAAGLLSACSGSIDASTPEPDESEDALATRALSNVVAIEFERPAGTVTIGAKAKVKKLIGALKQGPRSAFCAVRSETRMTLFDAKAEVVAEGTLDCFKGTLELATGGTLPIVIKPSDLHVLDEPLVVGDGLWGIDKLEVRNNKSRPMITKKITAKSDIDDVLEAIDGKQPIDTEASLPRCLPSRTIGFFRKGREVAMAGYSCSITGTLPASVNATFAINARGNGDTSGVIKLDPRPIEALLP